MSDDSDIRAIIRLIAPARALARQLEKARDLEVTAGLGDVAARNLQGLLSSVEAYRSDPYLESLAPQVPEDATDETKVSFVLLAVSQLVAYLEAEAGIPPQGTGENVDRRTNINFQPNIKGVSDLGNLGDLLEKVLGKRGMGADVAQKVREEMGKVFGTSQPAEPPEPPEPADPPEPSERKTD